MNIENILHLANSKLKASLVNYSDSDSEILLSKVLKENRKYILLNPKKKLKNDNIKFFNYLIDKRKKGEPIAYLTNIKEFWKYSFYIDNNVLIPRPDTEHLVEEVLKIYKKDSRLNILDIGTGSGCILLSILKERKNFYGTGIDISKKALNVAKINAKVHQLSNRIKFFYSDIDKFLLGKYDLIISNPPYIKKLCLRDLDKDIIGYEPKLALNGGIDGFSAIKKVIVKSSILLKRNGKLILEIGFDQKNKVIEILKKNRFYIDKIAKDYAKRDRCIISTKL